jgi:hypothetical protein
MRLPCRRLPDVRDDRGITVIEVGVASFVLAIAVSAVIGSMGAGMGLVGHSRQRSSGAGVAQERLERAHNVAYNDLALNEDPTYNADPSHPDHNVVENGPGPEDDQYRLSDGACAVPPCLEPLIINLADGGLKHLDDPFTLANTDFTVHQYVTWVDDPASGITGPHDYKRVTAVVTWKFPVHTGPRHTVTESTFVSDGVVTIPVPTSSPTPAPTAAPTPPVGGGDELGVGTLLGPLIGFLSPPSNGTGACTTDLTNPEFQSGELLSGSGTDQGYLNSTAVEVRIKARDLECYPITLYMANKTTKTDCTDATGYVEVQKLEAGPSGNPGDPPAVNVSWTIPPGDGFKAVCAVVRNKSNDASKNTSTVWGVNVKLDQTNPTVPGNFRQAACNISGNDRIATFNWSPSTDGNFYGYRLYRSVESGAFQLINQTTSLSVSNTSAKNYASVRYLVRAYDKAGNESGDSAIVSYAKNQC